MKRVGDGDDHVADSDGVVSLRHGVSKDRIVSAHDPEMRHGHKSGRHRIDGHKAAAVVDTDTRLITAPDLLPGKTWDSTSALGPVEQSGISAGALVGEAMGDTAYGDGGKRLDFGDAGRKLPARVPGSPDRKHFHNDDFAIDLVAGACTCPAGQATRQVVSMATQTRLTCRAFKLEGFRFGAEACGACPLRPQSTSAKSGVGRTVRLHPREALLQETRSLRQSPACGEHLRLRVAAEHRLAPLVQLGIRQARYFGSAKTRFQLYLAATVANLTFWRYIGSGRWSGPRIQHFHHSRKSRRQPERAAEAQPVAGYGLPRRSMVAPHLQRTQGFPLNF